MLGSYYLAGVVEDWNARLIIMFGVGGIAGIILAVARLRIATATAHKINVDTTSSQWVLIIENLHSIIKSCHEENKALSARLERAQKKEDIITFSKHEALKFNQSLNLFYTNTREIVAAHNEKYPECFVTLPSLTFVPLADILRAEDEARLKSAEGQIL
jgi:hypothetical protein